MDVSGVEVTACEEIHIYCMLYVLAIKNCTYHCVASYPSYFVV